MIWYADQFKHFRVAKPKDLQKIQPFGPSKRKTQAVVKENQLVTLITQKR